MSEPLNEFGEENDACFDPAETERAEKLAQQLYAALEAEKWTNFIGDYHSNLRITIDGSFNLRRIARALLRSR